MIYEPQTSYASKIDEDRRFETAEGAAEYDRDRAFFLCSYCSLPAYSDLFADGRGSPLLRRAILYLADLIREGETPTRPEPIQGSVPESRPMEIFSVWDDVAARFVPATSHRGVEIQAAERAKIAAENPEPTQEDFFKAYEEALLDIHTRDGARRVVENFKAEMRPRFVTNYMRTAWRAIGLDGEPTAERIRALRETRG